MHTFFIRAGCMLRLFFYAQIDTEIDTTTIYVRILAYSVRVRPPLPADKIPRRTLKMACLRGFVFALFQISRLRLERKLERINGLLFHVRDFVGESMSVYSLHDMGR